MANSRSAHHAILGYLYQFTKTLQELLESEEGTTLTVEGLGEDIDLTREEGVTAIQCKYHGDSNPFSNSSLYKPLLQMLASFKKDHTFPASYILYAHYPDLTSEDSNKITKQVIEAALASQDSTLHSLIASVTPAPDIDMFLSKFTFEPGLSWEDLEQATIESLIQCGHSKDDVETIFHPWAIHRIATLASKPNVEDRTLEKASFLQELQQNKVATVSRWTLALKTHKDILKRRRGQLQVHLAMNTRRRNVLVASSFLMRSEESIVNFIESFLLKYHFKTAHTETPLFALDCDESHFFDIATRLTNKGILYEDGYIGPTFSEKKFRTQPIHNGSKARRQTSIQVRLLRYPVGPNFLIDPTPHDIFLLGESDISALSFQDIHVEHLEVTTLSQAAYLLRMVETYD